MMKIINTIFLSAILIFFMMTSVQASFLSPTKKAELDQKTNSVSSTTYSTTTTVNDIIANVIRIILSVIGIVFIVLIFLAGQDWMQASGDEEKVKKAKTAIKNLMIGISLTLVAFALSYGLGGLLTSKLLNK